MLLSKTTWIYFKSMSDLYRPPAATSNWKLTPFRHTSWRSNILYPYFSSCQHRRWIMTILTTYYYRTCHLYIPILGEIENFHSKSIACGANGMGFKIYDKILLKFEILMHCWYYLQKLFLICSLRSFGLNTNLIWAFTY